MFRRLGAPRARPPARCLSRPSTSFSAPPYCLPPTAISMSLSGWPTEARQRSLGIHYHGWLIGYRVTPTLNSTANFEFASTPNYDSSNGTTPCSNVPNYSNTDVSNQCGLGGGIWMSGKGPAIYNAGETTYIVVGTGNGGVLAGGSLPSWGSSIVSFDLNTTCTTTSSPTQCSPAEFYTPSNYKTLNANDQDMGNRSTTRLNSSHLGISYAVFCL